MNDTEQQSGPLEVMSVSAIEAISRAEVDIQIATAKRYPRDVAKVKQNMLSIATLDEETAASCFYTVPRGGKSIQGPSIRLAEVATSCWGNIRAGTRVIAVVTTGDHPHVIVQGVCHDLERNVYTSMEKQRRITKKKSKDAIDEDDINLAVNACSAIAYRDAVYKVVPGAFIKPVWEAARETATGNATTLVDRRAKAVAKFAKMGVTEQQILAVTEKTALDQIDLEALSTLIGLYNAIKDQQTTIDEAFPPVDGKKPDIKAAAAGAASSPKPAAETAPVAATTTATTPAPKETKAPKTKAAKEEVKTPPVATTPELTVVPKPTPQELKAQDEAAEAAVEKVIAEEKAAEEAPAEPAATDEPPIHDQLRKFLSDHSVAEEEFMSWLENSGRYRNASKLVIDDLPEETVRKLAMDSRALGKCVSLYGKAPAATTPA